MARYTPAAADIYETENVFYLLSHPSRLAKLLAHYELYRMIADLPGAVIELGVFKGASLARFATFRNLLENDHSRPIYGFDAFGSFPRGEVTGAADKAFIDRFEAAGGDGIARGDLDDLLARKGFANIALIEGNVFDTIPAFLAERPAEKIALLHLDMDVYEPTAFAIGQMIDRMVPGGLILFDDYGMVEGATRAADEMCERHGLVMEKLHHYAIPAYATIG